MSKQINRNEIAEKGVLDNLLTPLKELLKVTDRVDSKLKDTAKTINESFKFKESSKGLRELEVNLQKTNKLAEQKKKVQQDQTKIEKQLADAKGRLNKLSVQEERLLKARLQTDQQSIKVQDQKTKQLITEERLKQVQLRTDKQIQAEKEKEARQNAKLAKQKADENNAYKQLSKASRDYKNESKRLGAELLKLEQAGDKNTKEFRDLSKQYKTVTASARTTDGQLKKLDQTVGDNFRNVGNYRNATSKLTGALGKLGIAFGIGAVVRKVGGILTGFNQTIAELSSITGATGEDLDILKQKAIELGGSTTLSASEVAESFKLIGSAKPELLESSEALAQVTESAIQLAEAAGIDMPQASTALTTALNQFEAGAEDASKFVDILAAGSKFGAGDINFLNEALLKAGTTANTAGIDFREAAAALEVIAKSGVPAQKAGTDFRNVLIKLQKEGFGFVDGQFDLQAALKESSKFLNDIQDPAEKAGAQVKLFGAQSQGTGLFLQNNIELLDEMTEKMDENGIAAEQQATNTDTLQGAISKLGSNFEKFVLQSDDATGATNAIKNAIGFLAENLATILKVVALVGAAFLSYKGAMIAGKVATTAYQAATKGAAIVQALFTGNLKRATAGMKLFNTAVKMNPIGLLISGIVAAVSAFALFGDSSERAKVSQEDFNKAIEDGKNQGINDAKELTKETSLESEKRIKQLEKETRKSILEGKSEQKAKEDFLKEKTRIIDEEIAKLEEKSKEAIDLQQEEFVRLKTIYTASRVHNGEEVAKTEKLQSDQAKKRLESLKNQSNEEIQILRDRLENIELDIEEHENKVTEKVLEERRKRQNALLLLQRRAEDLEDARIENEFERKEQQLKRAFDREMEAIKGNSKIENRLRKELEKKLTSDLKELRTERFEELQAIQDEYWLRQQNDEDQEVVNRLQRLDEEIKKVEDLELVSQEEKNELIKKLTKESEADITKIRTKFRTEREEKALQDEIDSLDKINGERELANIKAESTEEEFNKAEKERQIKHIDEMIALLEEYGDKEDEILGLKIERANLTKKTNKEEKDSFEDLKQTVEQVGNAIADIYSDIFQRQIDELKNQEDIAKQVYGTLEKLAAEGNIAAQESLAEQIQAQQDAQREQIKLQQKQANIEKARQVYAIIQSQLEAGKSPGQAIAQAGGFMTAIQGLIQSLPSFYEGTEDTGKAGKALDSKGGRLAVLHNNERVLTADQNKHLQGIPNPMIPVLVNKALDSAGNSYDLLAIDELRRTRQAIEKLPQSTYQLESAMGQIVKMVATHKTGNTTTKNTYK